MAKNVAIAMRVHAGHSTTIRSFIKNIGVSGENPHSLSGLNVDPKTRHEFYLAGAFSEKPQVLRVLR
jgi:hypothetical protein